ncbi:hypothetical protein NX028_25745 [Escherichia coli]|nr:hypothetical protein [Escherichia coli]
MAIRDENEMIIESRPSALDIHELTLRESFDRAWRESHEVKLHLVHLQRIRWVLKGQKSYLKT